MLTLDQLLTIAAGASTASAPLLVLFVFGLYREWWYMGKPVRELRNERDAWRRIALRAAKIADSAFVQARRQPSLMEGSDAETADDAPA